MKNKNYNNLFGVLHTVWASPTGLLATNQVVANKLNKLFLDHQIKKKYVVITKGIPNPREGIYFESY